jgi:hypothetical protein
MKQNKINLVVIAAAFFFLSIACSNADKTVKTNLNSTNIAAETAPRNEATPNAPPVAVKATDLTAAYDENELAADDKYKGKTLQVSGKVSNIAETLGKYTVQLEGHKKNGIGLLNVMCSFKESEKESIGKLKKGQTVTLTGVGDGKTLGFYVGLNECKIQ